LFSGHGCHGGGRGCHGGAACNGGGHGCHGGRGCHGGGFFSRHGCHGGRGCHGCNGGYACNGGGCHGGAACHGGAGCTGSTGSQKPAPPPEKKKMPAPEKGGKASAATINVDLPADAKLSIDDNVTKSTSANRVFATPALEADKEYVYTLKAEILRDGKPVTMTKKVTVRAGEETRIAFEFPGTSVAAN